MNYTKGIFFKILLLVFFTQFSYASEFDPCTDIVIDQSTNI